MLGDTGNTTEVDESQISHKSNFQQWAVGFIERGSQKARVFIVEDRSQSTMKSLFQENVKE